MFTVFDLIKSYPMTEMERRLLIWYLEKYSSTEAGLWLKSIHFRSLEYWYCYGMTAGVMGAFLAVLKKYIFLMPGHGETDPMEYFANPITKWEVKNPDTLTKWVGLIVSTAVHELRHKYQRQRMGAILYMICALPLIREFTIEMDAHRIWRQCDPYFQHLNNLLDYQSFLKRTGAIK